MGGEGGRTDGWIRLFYSPHMLALPTPLPSHTRSPFSSALSHVSALTCSLTALTYSLIALTRSLTLAQFFNSFTTLIMSSNYVTKRQSLKLLGEILLDRANFNVMTRYIANDANLKMMMNLLRDKSKNIQFEAFHVFKVRSPLRCP